ncbi:2-amino-3,7-dideoxy-D-threo-hept-6-ulosonate synthase [Streptomyces sp. DSM 15324]|uniref:2-amino-3,7-dideoxy-D-threo-hept-6-ulosonate synthase n=1 Tax=Streptomyces sp. DSM 15324 TaxID=1739111 RepID=UPI000746BB4C|nr:2-amino-3,7-dideoxy-D-threo-hept-6-ulosonate synthase [Streptomyces sp. DSM 15324]KUO09599.1 2-amino-4,5-dihydroxy-6-one-heptanoic acid-7-phosphate synthase [Streptomyces sp. DSM 15324]
MHSSTRAFNGTSSGRRTRLLRLCRRNPQRMLVVPLDHPLSDGPFAAGGANLNRLVGQLATNGADAVVLHKGSVRFIDPAWFTQTSLIVHLSASTAHAPDPDAKTVVGRVEEALRWGADAVSVHVNIGSREEARQIADMAKVAEDCDRWNVPLLAMMYPRGPHIADPRDAAVVAHAVAVAVELGADIVKTYCVDSEAEMLRLTASCPVPLLVAGGPRLTDEEALLRFVDTALRRGAAGVAMGRNVFESANPADTTRKLARLVHGDVFPPAPAELLRRGTSAV